MPSTIFRSAPSSAIVRVKAKTPRARRDKAHLTRVEHFLKKEAGANIQPNENGGLATRYVPYHSEPRAFQRRPTSSSWTEITEAEQVTMSSQSARENPEQSKFAGHT